jgi:hypothetical protein
MYTYGVFNGTLSEVELLIVLAKKRLYLADMAILTGTTDHLSN